LSKSFPSLPRDLIHLNEAQEDGMETAEEVYSALFTLLTLIALIPAIALIARDTDEEGRRD
jgi:hypothetical protein